MENKFFTWDDFVSNFGKEMRVADEIYKKMSDGGLLENCLSSFDFFFQSNDKSNLEQLSAFLQKHYPYTLGKIEKTGRLWELEGKTDSIPITNDNLMYWALDMSKRGFEFDAKFEGYGAPYDPDPKKQTFPDLSKDKEAHYFDAALAAYEAGNTSGSFINLSNVIAINPHNVDAYYSRAIVRYDLYTWKAAIRDYDKAIELAPDFISALVNRGSVKDENGDFSGAIADYDEAIRLAENDPDNMQKAYFNRGNSNYNLGQISQACTDWKKAYDLGADYALERINKYCTKT